MYPAIDITFDFRSDTPPGKDPDALSPTLHRYHQRLWSKPLPNGAHFTLKDARPHRYLHHRSEAGEWFLTSDTVIPSFRKEKRLAQTFAAIPPEEQVAFNTLGYTIGGMMLFPGTTINRQMTINAARGCHPRIKDRFDLTVECIRRFYFGEASPLTVALSRYGSFFEIFGSFRDYVDFFLLQDIVTEDYAGIRFHSPFAGFDSSPVPIELEAYLSYRQLASAFIVARNQRMLASLDSGTARPRL